METYQEIYYKIRKLILPIDLILRSIPDNSNILDLGCGKGILVKQLQNYNNYVGVDINIYDKKINNKLKFIKENCSNFIKKDLTEYNIFVLIDLLHHIDKDEQYKLVYTLARKMKKGDTLIIKDMSSRNIIYKYWNLLHDLIISKQIINYVDFDDIISNLEIKNFKIEKFYKKIFLYDHIFLILKKV